MWIVTTCYVGWLQSCVKLQPDEQSWRHDIGTLRYAISWFQGKVGFSLSCRASLFLSYIPEVSSFSMRILDYAAGGLAQKAQDGVQRLAKVDANMTCQCNYESI